MVQEHQPALLAWAALLVLAAAATDADDLCPNPDYRVIKRKVVSFRNGSQHLHEIHFRPHSGHDLVDP